MKNQGPRAIFCDFDGTIATIDGLDAALERFAHPSWHEWEGLWATGEISSRECLTRQIPLMKVDRAELAAFARTLPIDAGFAPLVQACRTRGVPFTILSDGLDVLIENVLAQAALNEVPHFSNVIRWDEAGAPFLLSPHSVDPCQQAAGTCKCSHVQIPRTLGDRVIYIGDGQSDFCVAKNVDFVYAKGKLIQHCRTHQIPHQPIQSLSDVAAHLFSTDALVS